MLASYAGRSKRGVEELERAMIDLARRQCKERGIAFEVERQKRDRPRRTAATSNAVDRDH